MWTGIASVVLSFLSFLSAPLGIVPVVIGIIGLGQLRHQPGKGRGNAVAGICCGVAGLLIPIGLLIGFGLSGG